MISCLPSGESDQRSIICIGLPWMSIVESRTSTGPSHLSVLFTTKSATLFTHSLPSVVKVKSPFISPKSVVCADTTFTVGSSCVIVWVARDGAGIPPKLLCGMFIVQSPEKFAPWARAEPAKARAMAAARTAMRFMWAASLR